MIQDANFRQRPAMKSLLRPVMLGGKRVKGRGGGVDVEKEKALLSWSERIIEKIWLAGLEIGERMRRGLASGMAAKGLERSDRNKANELICGH